MSGAPNHAGDQEVVEPIEYREHEPNSMIVPMHGVEPL